MKIEIAILARQLRSISWCIYIAQAAGDSAGVRALEDEARAVIELIELRHDQAAAVAQVEAWLEIS